MKSGFHFVLLGLLLLFVSSPTQAAPKSIAQTDEASARYLALTMARESGGHPDQYLAYARGLAQVLAQLTPEEQTRICGFKPPIAHQEATKESGATPADPQMDPTESGKRHPDTDEFSTKVQAGNETTTSSQSSIPPKPTGSSS